MKDIELKLISELVKNSRRSDRELAKALSVSQPTVSRIRLKVEKQGLIDYSAVPNLAKLGFEIMVVTFGKRDYAKHPEINLQKAKDFEQRHPSIIFGAAGKGLGYDRITVSIHRNYSDFSKFMQEMRSEWADIIDVKDSFKVSLIGKEVIQPISLKHFAEHLRNKKES